MLPIQVLVVDDSALMRKVLTDIINQDPNVKVVGTASNGREAIEAAKRLIPDVIIMDIQMPVMDGIEALLHIMHDAPLPVIMITSAYTSEESTQKIAKAIKSGAVDYILKPHPFRAISSPEIRDTILLKIRYYGNQHDNQSEP